MLSERTNTNLIRCAVAGMALLFAGCGGGDATNLSDRRTPVFTATSVRADLARARAYSGTVEGNRQATVYARLTETVVRLHAKEGDTVRKGTPLVSFDEAGPSSSVRQARALAEDARKVAEKYQRLYEQGAVSEVERDARQTAYDVANADYEAARDRAVVAAPITGVVTEMYARLGRQYNMGDPLALIAAVDTIRVLADVSVYESQDLAEGQRVTVRSQLDTSLSADGWVEEISTSADAESRTVSLEILAANPGHKLLPGLFVEAIVEFERHEQVVAVPRDALVYRQAGLGVFTVKDSTALYVPVTTGIESGALVEVINGLQAGETIVTLGQNNLQSGTRVNPAPQAGEGTSGAVTP